MIRKTKNMWNIGPGEQSLLGGVTFYANTSQGSSMLKLVKQQRRCSEHLWTGTLSDPLGKINGTLWAENKNGTLLLSVDLEIRQTELTQVHCFREKNGFELRFESMNDCEQYTCGAMDESIWWATPHFVNSCGCIPRCTQIVLAKRDGVYTLYLPLPTREAVTEFDGASLGCSAYVEGCTRLRGTFLAIRAEADPDRCIQAAYRAAVPERFPLREERPYPDRFRDFGFCTWDAFYTEVSAAGIEAKLRELQAKGVTVPWVLIDDGWMQTRDRMLCAFEEDRKKFPDGFQKFIARIKREYGVKKVGVWHTLQGYWHGIDPERELYTAQKENLTVTASGYVLPAWDEGKAFSFWNAWHTYLKEQGVDFVKVDNQSGSSEYACRTVERMKGANKILCGLEASVCKNFGGDILHCMGMGEAECFSRFSTGVLRSSDDFFPQRAGGFRKHAIQNAFNSYFYGPVYWCDWDMWWTEHETAVQSAVLRAVSGGPVYVSDKVGHTDETQLQPLMDADGRLLLCDGPGTPVPSQLMGIGEDGILTLRNSCHGEPVAAIFALEDAPSLRQAFLNCAELLPEGKEYVAYAALSRTFYRADCRRVLELTLTSGAEIVNFYPVEDGYIHLGDTTKYISLASSKKTRVAVTDLVAR